MANVDPGTFMMILMGLIMSLAVPVLVWAIMANRHDTAVKLWYAGLGCTGGAVLLVSFMQRTSFASSALLVLSTLLYIGSMRRERNLHATVPNGVWVAYAGYVIIELVLDMAGKRHSGGVFMTTSTLIVLQTYLLVQLWHVGRHVRSRGLTVIVIGVVSYMMINATRAAHTFWAGSSEPIFAYSVLSNAVILVVTGSSVLLTLGYVAFTLDKAHRRHVEEVEKTARAQEQRRLADQHAQELRGIIAQRDAMIVLNSRFSAVNSLAMYNSAIVHEISQPAQGLTSLLESLAFKPLEPSAKQGVDQALKMVGKLGATLSTLRRLISAQEPATERLNVNQLLQDILPIIQNEARRRGHRLIWQPCPEALDLPVQANKVLLERIVFNLVTNAFEAIEGSPPGTGAAGGQVVLSTARVTDQLATYASIEVSDNGPGMDEVAVANAFERFAEPGIQPGGERALGLGLPLAKQFVEAHGGKIELVSEVGEGTLVTVELPRR